MAREQVDWDKAEKRLIEIKEEFDKNGVTFFLFAGTLLGAVREKDFIPHDHDIDLGVFMRDSFAIKKSIDNLLKKDYKGGRAFSFQGVVNRYRIVDYLPIDIHVFFKSKDMYVDAPFTKGDGTMLTWWNNAKYFENLEKVRIRDKEYNAPSPSKEVVRLWYGPKWERKSYVNVYSFVKWKFMSKKEYAELLLTLDESEKWQTGPK